MILTKDKNKIFADKGPSHTSYPCAARLPGVLENLTKLRALLRVLQQVVDVSRPLRLLKQVVDVSCPFTGPVTSCGC